MDAAEPDVLVENEQQSILVAISQEMAASQESPQQVWLEIDGIEHLQNSQGKFIYRISLSTPVSFQPDQPLTFKDRETKEQISAHVLSSDDAGLVIETEQPLPAESRLMHVSFDPAFILNALAEFLKRMEATSIYGSVMRRDIPAICRRKPENCPGLNDEQCAAVADMSSTPIHFLWGPPGTGKTTTLGAAIAKWMRLGKSVLVVSTSNAAVDVAMRALLQRIEAKERKHVMRLGTTLDTKVGIVTLTAKLANMDCESGAAVHQAQENLGIIGQVSVIRGQLQRGRSRECQYSEVGFVNAPVWECQSPEVTRGSVLSAAGSRVLPGGDGCVDPFVAGRESGFRGGSG